VQCLGSDQRQGSLSLIGAVSPPGGDMSEPVVQATLRVVKVFWGLDDKLAFARHFPAINWLTSYSLYQEVVDRYAKEHVDADWPRVRSTAMNLLQREAELEELVRLVGLDALAPGDRLTLQVAKMLREDFLHQNAFDDRDTYTSLGKQISILKSILRYHDDARQALQEGAQLQQLLDLPVLEQVARLRLLPEGDDTSFAQNLQEITSSIAALPREASTEAEAVASER
jgi:V/A-type H+-transporting ATPase subunit A